VIRQYATPDSTASTSKEWRYTRQIIIIELHDK